MPIVYFEITNHWIQYIIDVVIIIGQNLQFVISIETCFKGLIQDIGKVIVTYEKRLQPKKKERETAGNCSL